MDHRAFCLSFLEKPRLFVRVRPGHEKTLTAKLVNLQIDFRDADPGFTLPFKTYSFAGGTKLDEAFVLNREAVVQDLSSQRTALLLKHNGKKEFEAWDCCAGSGGKSILLADLYPGLSPNGVGYTRIHFKESGHPFRRSGYQTDPFVSGRPDGSE